MIYLSAFGKKYPLTIRQLQESSVLSLWYNEIGRPQDAEYSLDLPLDYQLAFNLLYDELRYQNFINSIEFYVEEKRFPKELTGLTYIRVGILADMLHMDKFLTQYKTRINEFVSSEDCEKGLKLYQHLPIIKNYCLQTIINRILRKTDIQKFEQFPDQIKSALLSSEIKTLTEYQKVKQLDGFIFIRLTKNIFPSNYDREILTKGYIKFFNITNNELQQLMPGYSYITYQKNLEWSFNKFLLFSKLVVGGNNIPIFIPKTYLYNFYVEGIGYTIKIYNDIMIIYNRFEDFYGPMFPYDSTGFFKKEFKDGLTPELRQQLGLSPQVQQPPPKLLQLQQIQLLPPPKLLQLPQIQLLPPLKLN